MTNNLDATVFVFRHKDGSIVAMYPDQAKAHEQNPALEHVATIEPRMWIQAHYDEIERLRADLDAEKERSQELSQDKENWYRICELHATRLDSYQKAMRQAMSMLDQAEPRPEAAFSTLLLALNPDLERAKKLARKECV